MSKKKQRTDDEDKDVWREEQPDKRSLEELRNSYFKHLKETINLVDTGVLQ